MSHSRIPSPARSQGEVTPRRYKPRGPRSVGSPARSTSSGRLTAVIQFKENNKDSFALSPAPSRRSVLNDDTYVEEPRRRSWWKKLGENSRDVMEVLKDNKILETNEAVEEYIDIEVLSQEKKNYSIDIPDSSDSESISSIVIPQRKLFTQKDLQAQNKFGELIGTRESLAKLHKSNAADKTVNVAPKNLFNQNNKPRTKPIFPAALLNISANKTVNKTKEMVAPEVKGQARNLFGNRGGAKRKNMFANFIVSDSEDEIPEIQAKVFGFQKKVEERRESATSRGKREHSPTSSITTDIEMDEWQHLPSSTMVENQIEDMMTERTPVKKRRLSKLADIQESEVVPDDKEKESEEEQELKYDDDDAQSEQNNVKNAEKEIRNEDSNEVEGVANDQGSDLENESNQALQDNDPIQNKDGEDEEMEVEIAELAQDVHKDTSPLKLHNISKGKNKTLNESKVQQNVSLNRVSNISHNKSQHTTKTDEVSIKNKSLTKILDTTTGTSNNVSQSKIHNTSQNKVNNNMSLQKQTKTNRDEVDHEEQMEVYTEEDVEKGESQSRPDKQNDTVETEISHSKDNHERVKSISNSKENVQKQPIENLENIDIIEEKECNNPASNEDLAEIEVEVANKNDQVELEDNVENSSRDQAQSNIEVETQEEKNDEKEEEQNIDEIVEEDKLDESANQNDSNMQTSDDEIEDEQEEPQYESEVEPEESEEELNYDESEPEKSEEDQQENEEEEEEEVQQKTEKEEQAETAEEEINENVSNVEAENNSVLKDVDEEVKSESETMDNEEDQNESAVEDEEEANDESHAEVHNESNVEAHDESNAEAEESEEEPQEESEELQYEDAQSDTEEAQDDSEVDGQVSENEIKDSNEQDEMQSDNAQTPDVSNDTTGRYRKKNETKLNSPEAILHDKTNQMQSFTAQGRNTSIRKTTMLKNLNIRPSLAPPRESTGMSDGITNSSAEGSGWDSHRITKKTIRQTLGRDFTPRKSLRALVMEKSAKRQTAVNDLTSVTSKFPQANSTELPEASMAPEYEEMVAEANHDVSKRTRQTTLEMYLQKIKEQNLEKKLKMEEAVRNSLKAAPRDALNPFKVPSKPMFSLRKANTKVQPKAKSKPKSTLIPLDDLPQEVIEDMKYKPPKRFQPSNAPWITKRLYKYLESKLEPKYDYKARVRAEKLVESIYHATRELRRAGAAAPAAALAQEMARLGVVRTHFDFYQFFHDYMPREIRVKVVPDIVNKIGMPRHGVFSDILRGNTVQG